jgi:aldehyde dehydrogenase (NAD+)
VTTSVNAPVRIPGETELFIGGDWVNPATDRLVEVVNPATGQVIARLPDPSIEDADRAVAAGREAFDRGPWPWLPMEERIAHVRRFCDEIEARFDQLDLAWAAETGATVPLREAVNRVLAKNSWDDFLRLAAEVELTEIRDSDEMGPVEVRREPVGVVVNVLTYNGPVAHVGIKVVPAMLAGCPVIIKPAPDTPLVAHLIADAADAAGLPPGVVSVLAAGNEVSEHLVGHRGVDMVNFTGGTAIGSEIMARCASRLARCTLELGGKSAAIIADDIPLEKLMPPLLSGMLTFQGQICTALTRILVSHDRHDEIATALKEAFEGLRVGDPQDPETEWGPLAVERARRRAEDAVSAGLREGATLVTGGGRPEGFEAGFYFEPTLFTDVDNSMDIAQEEIFGPIYCLIRYEDIEDAIRKANDTRFGLFSAVFTEDRELALEVAHAVRVGTFAINGGGACLTQPFGGMKQSGIGRECGPEGLLEYTELKSTVLGDLAA